jgi:hypothetical protein
MPQHKESFLWLLKLVHVCSWLEFHEIEAPGEATSGKNHNSLTKNIRPCRITLCVSMSPLKAQVKKMEAVCAASAVWAVWGCLGLIYGWQSANAELVVQKICGLEWSILGMRASPQSGGDERQSH